MAGAPRRSRSGGSFFSKPMRSATKEMPLGDEILDEAYAGFSDEERTAFIDMLVRMRSNLARLAQGGPRSRNVFRKAS